MTCRGETEHRHAERQGDEPGTGTLARYPGEVLVDWALVDRVVARLNGIYVRKKLEALLAVAQVLIDEFAGGDIEVFRRRCHRNISYRKLAAREDLLLSAATLNRSVAILAQVRRLPDELAWALSETHHQVLLPVPDPDAELALARRAVDEGLSTRDFRRLVRTWLEAHRRGPAVGRPPVPALVRGLRTLHRVVVALPPGLIVEREALAALSDEDVRALLDLRRHRLPDLVRGLAALDDLARERGVG